MEFHTNHEYSFQEGIPVGYQPDFDLNIFNQPSHLILQSPEGWCSFTIADKIQKQILGLVHFHIQNEIARSPLRSPFASYSFSSRISEKHLNDFVSTVETKLKERGIKTLFLKNAPELYDQAHHELLRSVLLNEGYGVQQEEISAIIPVSAASFESRLHRSEKKRLTKCRKAELEFKVLPLDQLTNVYNLLDSWRKAKGYDISMSVEELKKTIEVFPDYFLLTGVMLQDKCVAANISIQVNSKVLYNFCHDHDSDFDHLSPVVLLNEGLYNHCQNIGLQFLDLGTSMANGILQTSLLDFKLRLGARPSRKVTFIKNLS